MTIKGVCWVCGKPATKTLRPNDNLDNVAPEDAYSLSRHFCEQCYEEHTARFEKIHEDFLRLRRTLMFERAIIKLEKQEINLYEYKDIIDQLQEYVAETPDKFDSSQEIMAAIVLVGHGVKCKPQYKIGKKVVDFLLPSLKVVLEIDGERHKYTPKRDRQRDESLRKTLGLDWEVVRIPTEHIEKNAKQLLPAILQLKADMQKERRKNGGLLPENYSSRHKAKRNWKPEDEEL